MTRRVLVLGAIALSITSGWWGAALPPAIVEVPPGEPVGRAIRSAPEGAVVRILPGQHDHFEISRPVTLEAMPGSTVSGPVIVSASGARLVGLQVVGGETGIRVEGADDVLIEGVTVVGAELHGIEVAPGSAIIRGCAIAGLTSQYAQGIEVRNSTGRPRTVVEGCTITSGQEGLVSHVARVEFRDNLIVRTTQRAIAVTEMSEGLVERNEVRDVLGSALYCGDMSHCEFLDNEVRRVGANPLGGAWQAGYGAVGIYHSTMRLDGNRFDAIAAPEPTRLSLGAALTDRSPLAIWPDGWRGAVPALWISAIALAGLGVVAAMIAPLARRRRRTLGARGIPEVRSAEAAAAATIVAGLAVQSFHMLEHMVQVFQVYVAEAEHRSGLIGVLVDTEWVHFVYNVAAFAFLVYVTQLAWSGRVGRRALGGGGIALMAAAVIQGYHLAERVAKLAQHLSRGIDTAPGLLGGELGLVWFHYGINLTVYAGFIVGVIQLARCGVLSPGLERRPARAEPEPVAGR